MSLVSQQVAEQLRRIKTLTWHKMKTVRIRSLVLQESFYPTADVPYAAVKTRMATLLGIVDRKSVLAYLGRPKYEQKSVMDQTVTYLKSGTTVPKKHYFRRKIAAKKGYIDFFGLGYVYSDKNDWWVHWNHKGLVNEVFLRGSQTRDDCVGVSHGDVVDEKISMQNISPTNMGVGEDVAPELHDSIEKDREERDPLGEREICQKQISQSCNKSVKSMEKSEKRLSHVRQLIAKRVEENWILITYDIPRSEGSIRKSVLRRLHRLGALQFTESVYYLPFSPEGMTAAKEVCKGTGSVYAWYSKMIEREQAKELTMKYILDITGAIENLETKVRQLEDLVSYNPKKAAWKIKELRQTYRRLHKAASLIDTPPLLLQRLSDVRLHLEAVSEKLRKSDERMSK